MSQSVIGALRVNLGLDSAQFERGLGTARKRLADMRRQFAAFSAAGAAVGVALGGLTVATARTANEITRMAQVANTTPAQLQRWSAATRTVGIDNEKLSDILKDVNDRVGDFLATGGGPMADFFENVAPKVGVTADMFRKLSGPDALQLYITSLEKAGASQQDMTFYLEAMASDATALLPLLQNGGAEMARLAENASSLGAVMDDQTTAALNRAHLAFGDVGLAMQGIGNRIAGELAPGLATLANAFTNSMRAGGTLRTVSDALISNLDRLGTYAATAVTWFGARYVGALVAAKVATMGLSGAMVALRGAIMRTGAGLLIVGVGELAYRFVDLSRRVGGVGVALNLLANVGREVMQRLGDGWVYVSAMAKVAAAEVYSWFAQKLTDISIAFTDMTWSIANALNSAFGMSLSGIDGALQDTMKLTERAAQEGAAAARGMADEAKNGLMAPLESVQALSEHVSSMGDGMDVAAGSAAGLGGALGGGMSGAGGAGGGVAGAAGKAGKAAKKLSDEAKAAAKALDDLRSVAEGWTDRVATPLENYTKQLKELESIAANSVLMKEFPNWAETQARAVKLLNRELAESLKIPADPMEDYTQSVEHLQEAMKAGVIDSDAYARGMKALNGELSESMPLVGDLTTSITEGLFNGFDDTLSSLKDIFKRWLIDMIAMAARNKIVAYLVPQASGVGAMGGGLMGGAGGLLGGLGSVLMGGASSFLSTGFAGLGSTLAGATSSLTGLATAAGALALPIAGAVAAFDFFRTKTKKLDEGVHLATDGMVNAVLQWEKIEKSRFWGLSKSRSTNYREADADIADPLRKAMQDIRDNVVGAADALGIGASVFEDFTHRIQLSTEGMTDEQALKALQDELTGLGNAFAGMVPGVEMLRREGEGAADALTRTVTSLGAVNRAFRALNLGQLDQTLAGGRLANSLVDIAGGLDQFAQATEYYFSNIMSAPDRLRTFTRQFDEALDAVNVAARPSTAAGFQALVERLMDAGRTMAATAVIGAAPLFDSMVKLRDELANVETTATGASLALAKEARAAEIAAIRADQRQERERAREDRLREFSTLQDRLLQLQGRENEIRRRALEALHPSNRAMLERIHALEDLAAAEDRAAEAASRMREALDAALGNANALADDAMSNLQRAVSAQQEGIRSRIAGLDEQRSRFSDMLSSSESLADQLLSAADSIAQAMLTPAQARQQREAALATLRMVQASGGVIESSRALESAITTLTGMDASTFSTELEMRRATAQAAYLTDAIGERALSDAEYYREAINGLDDQIELAEKQIDKLDQQLELGRSQLDAARGIAQGVMSMAQAIAGLQSAIEGLKVAQAASAGVAGLELFDYQSGLAARAANGGALTNWQAGELSEMQKAAKAVAGQTLYDYQQRILRNGINDMASLKPWEKAEFDKLVPGFAMGGDHAGGWRVVGERGPELEYTGPSRIYNAGQSRNMLGARDAEMAELVKEVRELRRISEQGLFKVAVNTGKSLKIQQREEAEKVAT